MSTIELQYEIEMPDTDKDALEALLDRTAAACFRVEGIQDAAFCVRITDDEGIRALNREMRRIDAPTDVLSFPTVAYPAGKTAKDCPKRLKREYDPYLGKINLGDCVLNLDRAKKQAAEFGHSTERELGYLTAHSAFHLMGYDHMIEEDKSLMREMEEKAMQAAGLPRDIDCAMLFEQACEVMKNAYCPYSGFQVGACLLSDDGRLFRGCNFENASYGATICAERCAVACAMAEGVRHFRAIAIVGSTAVAWPCGICRQVLREFAEPDMKVIVGQYQKGYTVKTLGELLPGNLLAEDLGVML